MNARAIEFLGDIATLNATSLKQLSDSDVAALGRELLPAMAREILGWRSAADEITAAQRSIQKQETLRTDEVARSGADGANILPFPRQRSLKGGAS
ncbi:hypothetical protein [Epibacterium ulvae]|uniref:hypothetical protein n=1 Tax=Epibacterium ulvae TaxID=1156985 RepID=UPI0024921E99|nr:hypothetical protein [Epibacterium ulvae]